MYAEFYRLSARPFQLTPDARFFFESTVHRQAMAYLVYGLHHAEGFIIITGEVGAGKTILVSARLEQLRQRVTAAYHLGPLSEPECRAYVEHRLHRADWKGDPHFDEDCYPVIYRHTGGVPRQINTLCSRLLLFGFLEQLHALTASAVEKVAGDLRPEIAIVTAPQALGSAPTDPVGGDESIAQINYRRRLLEER